MKLPTQTFLPALKIVMLSCASLHLVILGVQAALTGNYQIINIFNIVALSLLVPTLGTTAWGFWLSWGMVAVAFVVAGRLVRRRSGSLNAGDHA